MRAVVLWLRIDEGVHLAYLSKSFAANILKLVLGSTFAQILGILVAPILTRLFAPEAFGLSALFASITGVIGVIACFRYELSIMLPESNEEAAHLLCVSLSSVILMTVIISFAVLFAGDGLAEAFNSPDLKKYLWLIPVSVLFSGILNSLNYWNSRAKYFGRLSVSQIINSAASQTMRLTGGFAGYVGGGVLIVSTILGQLFSILYLALKEIWGNGVFPLKHISFDGIISGLLRYRKFPLIDVWGGLLNTISWQLPPLLLSVFFSPVIVGFYALGNAVIRLPMRIIGNAIAQVFYQKASDAKHDGTSAKVVEEVFSRLVAIGLFPMLVLSIIGQDLFSLVFGARWSEAGLYTQILAPWMLLTFISSPLSTLFSVFERQGSAFFIHSSIFLTRLASLLMGGLLQNVHVALVLFSLTGVITYGLLSMWNMRLAGSSVTFFFMVMAKHLLYFLPAGLILATVKSWSVVSPPCLISLSILLCLVYGIRMIRKDPILSEYFNMVCKKRKE